MEVLSPYKEATDVILEAGGEPLKLCYQCGLCTGVCPWNLVRSFIVRRLIHEAQLGATDSGLALPVEPVFNAAPEVWK